MAKKLEEEKNLNVFQVGSINANPDSEFPSANWVDQQIPCIKFISVHTLKELDLLGRTRGRIFTVSGI